jgi:hypothetical protein
MTKEKKEVRKRVISPRGTAVYPKLDVEDVYEGKPVGYKVELRMDADEAKGVFSEYQDAIDALYAKTKKELEPAKARKLQTNDLLIDHGDGTVSVKFSSHYKPAIFDAKGKLIKKVPEIWGGSVVKVAFDVGGTYVKNSKVGFKLYMTAVQILELKTKGVAGLSNGVFDAEEGYEAPEDETEDATEDDSNFDY